MARIGYPVIIGVMGLAVVIRYALFDYALASDSAAEFMVYSLVVEAGQWQIMPNNRILSSCLFTTYFPAMFQRVFNTDLVMTYKLFPCLFISTLPVAIYYMAKKWLAPHYAFLASVFLMAQIYFLWAPSFSRIMIALSFFALTLFVIFNERLGFKAKMGLLAILSSCLVVAHYGTVFVVFFIVSITAMLLIGLWKIKGFVYPCLKPILVFSVMLVIVGGVWLGVINTYPLQRGLGMVEQAVTGETYVEGESPASEGESPASGTTRVYSYFAPGTRGTVIPVAFGQTLPDMNVPQRIEFAFSWLTILLLSFGLVVMVKRWGLRNELVVLMCVAYLTIILGVIIPTLGVRYGIARVYFSAIVVLAPCFIVGGLCVAEKLRLPGVLVILVVLIPYGLCTSGIMHTFFGLVR